MSLRDLVNKYVVALPPEESAETPTTASGLPVFPTPTPAVTPPQGVAFQSPVTVPVNFTGATAEDVSKFSTVIQAAFVKSSLYVLVQRFEASMTSLGKFIKVEGDLYRAAAEQVGSTPEQLVQAYQSIIQVIQGEDQHMNEIIEGQRTKEIGGRQDQITKINAQIEGANNQIKEWIVQRDSIAVEATTMKTKLDTAENGFDGAAKQLQSGVEDKLRKLSLYITATAGTATK